MDQADGDSAVKLLAVILLVAMGLLLCYGLLGLLLVRGGLENAPQIMDSLVVGAACAVLATALVLRVSQPEE
jgi:uncharacterized membrane protein SpoIIM required for sporulation